jgi:hypothetical protein
MRLSSIFSFESLRTVKPRMPWTVLGVVGLLVAVEAFFRVVPVVRLEDPDASLARIGYVERHVLPKHPYPRLVVFGSSRSMAGISPRLLDRNLDLPPYSCVNASVLSGMPSQAVQLYLRNRPYFRQADLVILNVDEWHLNAVRESIVTEHTDPILAAFPNRGRFETLLNRGLAFLHLRPNCNFELFADENDRLSWIKEVPPTPQEVPAEAHRANVRDYYKDFRITPTMTAPIETLARLVREDGNRFVLMQMPNAPAHQAEVERTNGDDYRLMVATIDELARKHGVPFYAFREPSECGLTADSYMDGVHLHSGGAVKFTRFLADLIRKDRLLPRENESHR